MSVLFQSIRPRSLLFIATLIVATGCSEVVELKTDTFLLQLNNKGDIVGLIDLATKINYLADGRPSPLLSIRVNGSFANPASATYATNTRVITLTYPDGRVAEIGVVETDSHIRFELTHLSPRAGVELVVWGPYPTVLNDVIGETVGVVQGQGYALGIQSLNPKTLGGYPWNENDALPQLDIFESGDFSDLNPSGKRGVLYRVEAAKPDTFGSTLQAYTRERTTDRIVANRGYEEYVARAYDDGGIIGSKIALFGSPRELALSTIGKIELTEGLPHPMIDGEWGKISKGAAAAYLIMGFGEDNIEKALEITRQTGLRYLYHPDAFETWGHFRLKESDFPGGEDGLRKIVDRAEQDGIMVGAHMLSNFITPNDAFVTPIPDERLARVGSTVLSSDIGASSEVVPIESPRFFNQAQQSFLRASVIDNEIIQCAGITDSEPWQLTGCERGVFGTTAASHAGGTEIGKLDDHAYNVFLTNAELTIEMSRNMADLYNATGLRQISFDGLEGNRSTGMGNYGEILFTQTWFDTLNEDIRNHYIADASRTSHYFWHMYTRMNWGEPWYAGFRESQTEYRLKNQAYFKRNMMPGMLGWFSMRPETSIEDIEWMLARSAGFDAGYGFVTGFDQIENNGSSDEILSLLGLWEAARMADVFSETQKEVMQDIKNEFHLEAVDESSWDWYPVKSLKFAHIGRDRQPGEPTFSTFTFSSDENEEEVLFILTPNGSQARNIEIKIDNKPVFRIETEVADGQHLKYTGGKMATVYSSTWEKIRDIPIPEDTFSIHGGEHSIRFNADINNESEIKFEVRLISAPERIRAR